MTTTHQAFDGVSKEFTKTSNSSALSSRLPLQTGIQALPVLPPPSTLPPPSLRNNPPSDEGPSRSTINIFQQHFNHWAGIDGSLEDAQLEGVHVSLIIPGGLRHNQEYAALFSSMEKAIGLRLRARSDSLRRSRILLGSAVTVIFMEHPELGLIDRTLVNPEASVEVAMKKITLQNINDLTTLITLRTIADLAVAGDHGLARFFRRAESLYIRIGVLMEEVIGRQHVEYSRLLFHRASCVQRFYHRYGQGNIAQANDLLLRASTGFREALGQYDPETIGCIRTLAQVYLDQGKNSIAKDLLLPLYSELKERRGADDLCTIRILGDLAELEKIQEAESNGSKGVQFDFFVDRSTLIDHYLQMK